MEGVSDGEAIKEIELYSEGRTKSLKIFNLDSQALIYPVEEKSLGCVMKS